MSAEQESSQPFRWHYAEYDDGAFHIRGRTLFFMVVLISIVLLFTLLCLYARWVWRATPPAPPPTPQSIHAPPAPAQGLDPTAINELPTRLYTVKSSGELNAHECCICLGVFQHEDTVKTLPQCRHWFHSDCVDKWLVAQSSCPLCRAALRVDSQV